VVSGIAGILYLDGRTVLRKQLEQMNSIQAHRGSDGAGLWTEGSVGLAHRLLWTTPESLHERLPMVNTNSDIVLTADARIDNREELIDTLGLTDSPNHELPDSALLLAAYEKWGERCPERLLGDFAFAVWDNRHHRLFCARDHFGVRPFYYYHRAGKIFAFASEIKALLCLPEVPRQLNEMQVADFLSGIFEDKARTFYQGVLRLPPSRCLTVTARALRQNCYWSLDATSELRLGSDEEYAETYRQIFTEAVRCRLRSAFPIGSHLSGGLDSSSITCVARDLLGEKGDRRLNTYSIVFDKVPESDERPFINAVVDAGGVEPHYIRGDTVTPLTDVERVLWHQDEPFHGPNLFLNWQVWSAARQQGIRVLLDGIMGDNVVSHGFAYLNELARSWCWVKLVREIKTLARRRSASPWKVVGRYVWNDGIKSRTPAWLKRVFWQFETPVSYQRLSEVIDRDFARRVGLDERVERRDEFQQRRLRSAKEDHYQELVSGIIPAAMEVAAKGAAAFNIEVRVPFLDRRLVELCFGIPPEQKIRDGWSRAIVRRALANTLPPKVRLRTGKGNMGPNFIRGLISAEETLRKLLFHGPPSLATYINRNALHRLYYTFITKSVASEDDLLMILSVALLSNWLQQWSLTNESNSVKSFPSHQLY
jgi:asparagine synthase (glutamine-hydrolysing)